MRADVLDWLVPDARAPERERMRRFVTGARLLCDDAGTRCGETVGLDLRSARTELEGLRRARLLLALETLLHAHLEAAGRRDSFLDLGAPRLAWARAWRTLVRPGNEKALPALPQVGEDALAVSRRLLAAALELGAGEGWRALWSARVAHVAASEPAEEPWRAAFERARSADRPLVERAALLAGLLAAHLDRGDPRGARALLEGAELEASVDEGTCRLFAWAALLAGDTELARELAQGLRSPARRVPQALLELRAYFPDWAPLLAGPPPAAGRPAAPERVVARAALGAVVLGVFAPGEAGDLCVLHLDAAPGVRAALARRLAERDGAWRRPGEPEQRLLVEAAPQCAHRSGRDRLRGALAPELGRALLLVPIPDEEGETAGWLHVETEHHLLPSHERARAIAAGWSARVVAAQREPPAGADPGARRVPAQLGPLRGNGFELDDPRHDVFEAIVAELALKTARRRVWLVEPDGAGFHVLAEAGAGLADWRQRRGGARALRRSLWTGAAVAFDGPELPLGLHAAAASGVVLPLAVAGRVHGFLALESERRGDFAARDRERLEATGRGLAQRWRAAQFASWHRERFGHEVHWDARSLTWEASCEAWIAAARSNAPLWIAGPAGAGKQVLARWMHFEGADPGAPFLHAVPGEPANAGTCVLAGSAISHELGRRALVEAPGQRVIALARALPEDLLGDERLARDLLGDARLASTVARCFSGRTLRLPPLLDRRDEVPGLALRFLARFAREEGVRAPELSDETLALLWRQSWPDGLRTLAELVHRLVLLRPAGRVEPGDVAKLARPFGLELCERLPSRRPRARDLLLALCTTAHKNGAWNKTRAARYLGWDPDTLDARLAERGPGFGRDAPG